jgi:hypothetical protein
MKRQWRIQRLAIRLPPPPRKIFFQFFSVETKKEEFLRLEYALKTVF